MIRKFVSSVMCGAYIGIGATAYLLCDNPVLGALFFTTGIFLVVNFFNNLLTRVCPLFPFKLYKVSDIFITFFGNIIGGIFYAFLINLTRLNEKILPKLTIVVETKINDELISIFIMAILCGVLVSYGVLSKRLFPDNKGIAFFLTFLFISAFVVCGFDHVVANMFYYSLYSFNYGFNISMIPSFLVVLAGNAIAGIGVGYLEIYRNKQKEG